ncbi:unnamed protein product [Caenorhabditis sp. 36 PRJEB53466]|nr:unnamed protein product [Caenorhabditis sp. 36 PRJEB53466]
MAPKKKQVKARVVTPKNPVNEQSSTRSGRQPETVVAAGSDAPMEIEQAVAADAPVVAVPPQQRGRKNNKAKKGPVVQSAPAVPEGPASRERRPGETDDEFYSRVWKITEVIKYSPASTTDTWCSLKIAENKRIKEQKEAAARAAKGLGPKPADPPVYDHIIEPETDSDSNPSSGSDSEPEEEPQAGPGPSTSGPAPSFQNN